MNQKPNDFFRTIQLLTGDENKITLQRLYCEAMGGDLAGGAFLGEIIFWCDKGKSPDGFFYRSSKEWNERVYLSEYQIRKYAKLCQEFGFLETDIRKANGAPTTHYRLNQKIFSEWIMEFSRIHSEKIQNPGFSNFSESLTDPTDINSRGPAPSSKSTNQPINQSPPIPWQRTPTGKEITFAHLNKRCPAATRLPVVNALIAVHGLQALIDADHPDADRKLNEMHELACALHEMKIGEKDIQHFYKLWQEKDFRGQKGQRPQNGQFFAFISQQLADTSGFPVEDPGTAPAFTITDTWDA